MFSNVGMNPYGPGGSTVTPQSPTSSVAPGADARSAAPGERGAAAMWAETPERVDPPRQPTPSVAPDREERRAPRAAPASSGLTTRFTLMPPPDIAEPATTRADADAPVGPPPAFTRSPLQAQRDEASLPDPDPARISAPDPVGLAAGGRDITADAAGKAQVAGAAVKENPAEDLPPGPADTDPLEAMIRRIMADAQPLDVPPSPGDRAAAEFCGLRRMELPQDRAAVDVMR